MKVRKILEDRLDIKNTEDMYSINPDEKVIQLLSKKYVGRCYKHVFITKITKIIKRSRFKSKQVTLDGTLYTDIQFEVDAIVYEKGDIIHNCKIVQINNDNTMLAKSEHVSIYVKNLKNLTIFKEGDEIAVSVATVKFGINDTEISILAEPLLPITPPSVIYSISVNDTTEIHDMSYIVALQSDIKTLVEKLSKLRKSNVTSYNFFNKLLYPYKEQKNTLKLKSPVEILDINSSLKKLSKESTDDRSETEYIYLYKPISLIHSSTINIVNKELDDIKKEFPGTSFIEIKKENYIKHILNEYKKNLYIFIEFIEIYNSEALIKKHAAIWLLYNTQKL
ncbi:MAG: hypothetical protein ACRCZI_04705 [Cetobacterium sp.]